MNLNVSGISSSASILSSRELNLANQRAVECTDDIGSTVSGNLTYTALEYQALHLQGIGTGTLEHVVTKCCSGSDVALNRDVSSIGKCVHVNKNIHVLHRNVVDIREGSVVECIVDITQINRSGVHSRSSLVLLRTLEGSSSNRRHVGSNVLDRDLGLTLGSSLEGTGSDSLGLGSDVAHRQRIGRTILLGTLEGTGSDVQLGAVQVAQLNGLGNNIRGIVALEGIGSDGSLGGTTLEVTEINRSQLTALEGFSLDFVRSAVEFANLDRFQFCAHEGFNTYFEQRRTNLTNLNSLGTLEGVVTDGNIECVCRCSALGQIANLHVLNTTIEGIITNSYSSVSSKRSNVTDSYGSIGITTHEGKITDSEGVGSNVTEANSLQIIALESIVANRQRLSSNLLERNGLHTILECIVIDGNSQSISSSGSCAVDVTELNGLNLLGRIHTCKGKRINGKGTSCVGRVLDGTELHALQVVAIEGIVAKRDGSSLEVAKLSRLHATEGTGVGISSISHCDSRGEVSAVLDRTEDDILLTAVEGLVSNVVCCICTIRSISPVGDVAEGYAGKCGCIGIVVALEGLTGDVEVLNSKITERNRLQFVAGEGSSTNINAVGLDVAKFNRLGTQLEGISLDVQRDVVGIGVLGLVDGTELHGLGNQFVTGKGLILDGNGGRTVRYILDALELYAGQVVALEGLVVNHNGLSLDDIEHNRLGTTESTLTNAETSCPVLIIVGNCTEGNHLLALTAVEGIVANAECVVGTVEGSDIAERNLLVNIRRGVTCESAIVNGEDISSNIAEGNLLHSLAGESTGTDNKVLSRDVTEGNLSQRGSRSVAEYQGTGTNTYAGLVLSTGYTGELDLSQSGVGSESTVVDDNGTTLAGVANQTELNLSQSIVAGKSSVVDGERTRIYLIKGYECQSIVVLECTVSTVAIDGNVTGCRDVLELNSGQAGVVTEGVLLEGNVSLVVDSGDSQSGQTGVLESVGLEGCRSSRRSIGAGDAFNVQGGQRLNIREGSTDGGILQFAEVNGLQTRAANECTIVDGGAEGLTGLEGQSLQSSQRSSLLSSRSTGNARGIIQVLTSGTDWVDNLTIVSTRRVGIEGQRSQLRAESKRSTGNSSRSRNSQAFQGRAVYETVGIVNGRALGSLQVDAGQTCAVVESVVQRGEVGGQLHGVQLVVNHTTLIQERFARERCEVLGVGQVENMQRAVTKHVCTDGGQHGVVAGYSHSTQFLTVVEGILTDGSATLGNFELRDGGVLEATVTDRFNLVVSELQRGQLRTAVEGILAYSVTSIGSETVRNKFQGRELGIAIESRIGFADTIPAVYDLLNVVLVGTRTILFSEVGGDDQVDVTSSQSSQTIAVKTGNLYRNGSDVVAYSLACNGSNFVDYESALLHTIDCNLYTGTDHNACARILTCSQCN